MLLLTNSLTDYPLQNCDMIQVTSTQAS